MWNKINKPAVWGLLYLLQIPFFAVLYYLNSSSFYDSNVSHEALYQQNKRIAESGIENMLSNSNKLLNCSLCERDIVALHFNSIHGDINNATFKGTITSKDANQSTIAAANSNHEMRGEKSNTLSIENFHFLFSSAKNAIKGSLVFFSVPNSEDRATIKAGTTLPTDARLTHALKQVIDGQDGIYGDREKGYFRHFYLSIVTITTLGYGDIVPIDQKGRMLISIEALLGVIIIGLFFGSMGTAIVEKK